MHKSDFHHRDQITKNNFEHFLETLKIYFQFFIWFDEINDAQDKTINIEEFKNHLVRLEDIWEQKIEDPDALFEEISNGDTINFEEFAEYSTHRLMKIKAER